MNTTFSNLRAGDVTWPSGILTAKEPENERNAPTKDRAEVWEIIGCVIVLAFIGSAGGLWAWTIIEFLRLLVETIPEPLI